MKIFAEVHITFHTPIFTVRQNDGDESIGSVSASKVDSVSFSQVCYQVRGLNETSAVIEIYKTTGARAIFIFDMSNVSTFMAIPSLVTQSSAVN